LIRPWSGTTIRESGSLNKNIEADILEVFGAQSLEYRNHQSHKISRAGPINLATGVSNYELQQWFAAGIPDTLTILEGLIAGLEERKSLARSPATRARATFAGLDLHPRIATAASDLFRGGHYRNAVLDASLALMKYVKEKSGEQSLDGVALMRTVFSTKAPASRSVRWRIRATATNRKDSCTCSKERCWRSEIPGLTAWTQTRRKTRWNA